MIFRSLALPVAALLLCAASEPPPQLQAYIDDGQFEPGDYGWMKGRFADATPEEKAEFAALMQWQGRCFTDRQAELREQLTAEGVAIADPQRLPGDPFKCAGFTMPYLTDTSSFAAFQRELAAVQPIVDTYFATVVIAEEASEPHDQEATLARQLEARPVGEQMVRMGLNWARGTRPDSPTLTPMGRQIFEGRLSAAMIARDHANTEWLKGIIAERGWPKKSEVGKEAASNAWLLAQHADADPMFQLQVLRLMEPLVPQGEVSQQNYAYLYDRIMLKVAGKQRYGTQATCVGGHFVPQPLEDEASLDRLRGEVGLPPIAEYMELMENTYGTCQEPPKPS
jgi:hypothetical protein